MKIREGNLRLIILTQTAIVAFFCTQCTPGMKRQISHDAIPLNEEQGGVRYLKVHMKDGTLYNLNFWVTSLSDNVMKARGEFFDQNRNLVATSADTFFTINMTKVALYESNKITGLEGKIAGQALIFTPIAIITIYCAINPKACFGSCPTFYAWDGNKMRLMAEGFSSSIARVFEKPDIDMLHSTVVKGREFKIQLTNEALETHAIKYADLLVFPRSEGERIFATPSGCFYSSDQIIKPSSCDAPEGDCLAKVLDMDQSERFSAADPNDLTIKETIEVEFKEIPNGKLGLIIGSRQTLMTTFLFYQGMAHAGSKLPYYHAQVESGNESMQHHLTRIWDLLGGIEVQVQNNNGKWVKAGEIAEMGPIAADLQLVTLPEITGEKVKVRIKMTKGLWRIDQVGLIVIDQEVQPIRIKPACVLRENVEDETALNSLIDSTQYLLTFPGDRYELIYNLPDDKDYEIFLHSKGYYLEWMREDWIKEENNFRMAVMFAFPKQYLKMMAPEFKEIEPFMEYSFWNSRYVKQ